MGESSRSIGGGFDKQFEEDEVSILTAKRCGIDSRTFLFYVTLNGTANLEPAEADWPRVRAAAEIKADGGLSYADCFALALASEAGAPLLTADPEIVRAAERRGVAVMWPGLSGAPEGSIRG